MIILNRSAPEKLKRRSKEVRSPNICFLPTATGDADEVIERFYNAKLSENVTHFPLFKFDAGWKETLFEQEHCTGYRRDWRNWIETT